MRRPWAWVILAAFFLLLDARGSWAGCFMDLRQCYYEAARYDSWVQRSLAGLDCELNFTECLRQKIGGW